MVYIQSKPTEESRKQLEALQEELFPHAGGSARMSRHLHLTLLHIGKPRGLFRHMQQYNSGITPETFSRALAGFIARTHGLVPYSFAMMSSGLDLFSDRRDVLALQLEPNETYRCANQAAMKEVYFFIRKCGITQVESFIEQDNNLRFLNEPIPHVTLLRGVNMDEVPRAEAVPDFVQLRPTTIVDPTGDN